MKSEVQGHLRLLLHFTRFDKCLLKSVRYAFLCYPKAVSCLIYVIFSPFIHLYMSPYVRYDMSALSLSCPVL
jgi:hypothetical protein